MPQSNLLTVSDGESKSYGPISTKLVINLSIVVSIIVLIYYGVPYLYSLASESNLFNTDDENYTAENGSDTQGDLDIVKEIKSIRERQKQNITKLSQT